jgi:hypothetical protein
MKRFAAYKYQTLLIALLLMIVVYPILRGPGEPRLPSDILITGLFAAGGSVLFADRRLRIPGLALAVPAVVGVWVGFRLSEAPGPAAAVAFHLSAAAFEALLIAAVLRAVYREETVSADAISGALCGYLLVGVAFGHAYCLIDAVVPGSFRGLGDFPEGDREHFLLTYFSFATLTTVGYGDVAPASGPARSLSVVEAVVGQFYLAVLIADLIGKRVSGGVKRS